MEEEGSNLILDAIYIAFNGQQFADPSAVAVSFDLASREPGEGDRGPTRTNEDVAELIASLRGETANYSKPGKKSPVPLP